MASSARTPYLGRKRTKTFTGCWTCRSRKIKCDETTPHCFQCISKGVKCKGYGVRLHWLPPITGLPANTSFPGQADMDGVPGAVSSRRQLPPAPRQPILTCSQVESILWLLDSTASNGSTSPRFEGASVRFENFGVFRGTQIPEISREDCMTRDSLTPYDSPENEAQNRLFSPEPVNLAYSPVAQILKLPEIPSSLSSFEAAAAWELCKLHEHIQQPERSTPNDPTELDTADTTAGPQGIQSHEENDTIQALTQFDGRLGNEYCPTIGNTPAPSLPSQERFLMHHYMHSVVNIFCVIDNAKSPWKTIHLPQAIQGVGEVSIMGQTSRIRDALKNALLSISSFQFSNVEVSGTNPNRAGNWIRAANQYRCKAITLLKQAVEIDLYSSRRPKYKVFLATMLSMITITVMSGETTTCRVHLDGAKELIRNMGSGKARLSNKAQALHRIYFYLRVIYESTASSCQDTPYRDPVSHYNLETPEPSVSGRISHHRGQEDNPNMFDPVPTTSEMVTCTYEHIYGIPQSLLVLLNNTIELVRQVDNLRKSRRSNIIPEELEKAIDAMEGDIFDWSIEEELDPCRKYIVGTSFEITHHQTKAFHNALIIYFSQNVRLLSYRYLQQYVEVVLRSIETIETIKSEAQLLAAPLFWPAFVAATEAFDQQHQRRFRKWYEKASVYGIKAVRTGIRVVYEVWERGPVADGRVTSLWRAVIERTGETLMLT